MTSPTATSAKPPRRVKPKTAAEAAPPAAPAPVAPAAVETPPENDAGDTSESGQSVATQHSRALSIPGVQATFTERSLILPEKLTVKRWLDVVNAIDGVREGARWWFGDALIQGEARYGETYAQALDAGKYDLGTLRNLRSVANRYKPADRIYDLSWSHYNAAMSLPLDVAKDVLKQAVAEGWSVVQVRLRIKEIKSGDTDQSPAPSNGQTAPNSAVVRDEDLPGVKPITDVEAYMSANPGKTLFDCGGCDRVFAEQVWHCVGCSGHWPLSEDECPNELCGQDTGAESDPVPTATTAPAPSSAAPRTVTGTVVTAADTGADQALTVLMSFPFADLDPSDIAASILASDGYADPIATLMSVHQWLGQVIEATAAEDNDESESDDDETDEGEDDESGETIDDGLGDLDFGSGDDQEASETDETDGEAADDDTATTEAPAATKAASRTGAWSTKGADVIPDATPTPSAAPPARPLANEPARPAPKPGSGKPVRQRRAAAQS